MWAHVALGPIMVEAPPDTTTTPPPPTWTGKLVGWSEFGAPGLARIGWVTLVILVHGLQRGRCGLCQRIDFVSENLLIVGLFDFLLMAGSWKDREQHDYGNLT